eukprot:TRINITY_DN72871_c0_g1_i1.p1 TRINITY_DN72871_c0_g1~~TRINITY_DN72871_c0_g1_i1.p1  ORF type:complete len:219 (+),score=63.67 TRINITY_DN72871_c0_g1_i1:375-1031(+)
MVDMAKQYCAGTLSKVEIEKKKREFLQQQEPKKSRSIGSSSSKGDKPCKRPAASPKAKTGGASKPAPKKPKSEPVPEEDGDDLEYTGFMHETQEEQAEEEAPAESSEAEDEPPCLTEVLPCMKPASSPKTVSFALRAHKMAGKKRAAAKPSASVTQPARRPKAKGKGKSRGGTSSTSSRAQKKPAAVEKSGHGDDDGGDEFGITGIPVVPDLPTGMFD